MLQLNLMLCFLSSVLRSDCVDILTQCGDKKRFHEGQTPERICELLSPIDDPERCIPLHRYLSKSHCTAYTPQENLKYFLQCRSVLVFLSRFGTFLKTIHTNSKMPWITCKSQSLAQNP